MTGERDIVLVYFEDKPMTFARIEKVDEDIKPGWYRVKLFMLQVPLQSVTWTLRDIYIDGAPFTMGGNQMRLEKVECPDEPKVESDQDQDGAKQKPSGSAEVIQLKNLKKK
jgi:hypothetical protein